MSSKPKASAPAAAPAPAEKAKGNIRWNGNEMIIEGNVSADDIVKAQNDKKAADDLAFKANSTSRAADKETPDQIAEREKATLANPKKQRLRGRRTLVADSPLGSQEGLG